MQRLRADGSHFIIGLGIGFLGIALAGMALVLANAFLPRNWIAQLFGGQLPSPLVGIVGGGSADSVAQNEFAAPPTPDFRLSDGIPRIYYLWIPKLGLYAPVIAAGQKQVQLEGLTLWQMDVPQAYAVGWSTTSAPVGVPGNTVFSGHNNEFGDVFKDLWYLGAGDAITVQTENGDRQYVVSDVAHFEEKHLALDARLANAQWLAPTADERLMLITCWPYYTNTHRLVVVALPK